MSPKLIKTLLLVEDNPGDARLIREMLNEEGSLNTQMTHVECMSDAETHLAKHAVDIILFDLGLPDVQGLEAIRRAHAAAPGVPLVVLTGLDDESMAVQALQLGAQDYLIKGQIEPRGLLRALRYAIERKTMESAALAMARQMAHSAEHDFLTGLPNRMLLNDRISQAIALAPRHTKKVAVLFLDLDGFKHINDSLGHPTGDKLLQSIAKRLVDCVRGSDTVSRQGGDEFVVLLSEVDTSGRCGHYGEKNAAGGGGASFHRPARSSRHHKHRRERLSRRRPGCGDAHQERGHRDVPGQGKWAPELSVFQAGDECPGRGAAIHRGGSAARPGTAGIRAALPAEDQSDDRSDYRGGSVDTLDASHARIGLSGGLYSGRGRLRPHSADRRLGPS